MKKYTEMTKDELMQEKTALEAEYEKIKNLGLSLDMSRGKPGADQLDQATIKTIEDGKMTKDLALITTMKDVTVLNSENFIKAIRETLEGMLA
jgi:isocitrate dehydrogenase